MNFKGIFLNASCGFFLGLLLLPAALFQTQWAEKALKVDIACCESSQEGSFAIALLLGLVLGPLLGAFTATTMELRARKSRAARPCAFFGAVLCGVLPSWITVGSFFDPEVKNEPNGALLMAISASLPLAWSLCLLLFALFARPFRKDEP